MSAARELHAASPAKINLTLAVGALRADGFHPLESFVTRIGLCDEIRVRAAADGKLVLECDDPAVPGDDTNLVLRAAAALRAAAQGRAKSPGGAQITLVKRIPMGAGLGGGSSNAATTLRLLNQLWATGFSDAELAAIGATLGSDVPLFLYAGVCRISGRGEVVKPLQRTLKAHVALILPPLHCSTPAVYRAFDALPLPASRAAAQTRIPALLDDADALMPLLFNDLEPAAFRVCPPLAELVARLGTVRGGAGLAGGSALRMSGSGSALFRLFGAESAARAFAEAVGSRGVRCEVCCCL